MVVVLVVVAILAAADLMGPNSLLRSLWGGDGPTRQQEVIQEMNRRGLPVTPR